MREHLVKLYLAPMEGVTDFVMRDLLTRAGGIDQCVTEFLRVTRNLHPESVFLRNCPELRMGSKTAAGTPVFVQLLGGQPEPMAENAARAASLGALGIDLNFGCPAKTVNRHDGGAVLLQYPERIFAIAKAVRTAVPSHLPVTAKMRLGFENTNLSCENAQALSEAGVNWITVHCRTKNQGYRPPAHWEWIPKLQEQVSVPLVANGDISSVADFFRCREVTSSREFMLGRGAIANPGLFREIKMALLPKDKSPMSDDSLGSVSSGWEHAKQLLPGFFQASSEYINPHFATARTKQWLRALAPTHLEARQVFDQMKTRKAQDFLHELNSALCKLR